MIRFGCLGSGSRGNALVVEVTEGPHTTRVLVDCGFASRETAARLARLGLTPRDISAVLVTHEHSDHLGGVFRFAARHDVRVFLTHGTLSCAEAGVRRLASVEIIDSHQSLQIGGIEVHPFAVPHDAREPVQFVFSDGARRLGLLTDTGHATAHVERMLSGVDALILECNHDLEMLASGNYPVPLRRRISGAYGHLDNGAAARLLSALDRNRLQHLVAAHLSQQNNTAEKAREALAQAAGCEAEWISIADQDAGFDWREIR